jgi:hypothetical protein
LQITTSAHQKKCDRKRQQGGTSRKAFGTDRQVEPEHNAGHNDYGSKQGLSFVESPLLVASSVERKEPASDALASNGQNRQETHRRPVDPGSHKVEPEQHSQCYGKHPSLSVNCILQHPGCQPCGRLCVTAFILIRTPRQHISPIKVSARIELTAQS